MDRLEEFIAARIKDIRGQLNLSQRKFSIMTGISQSNIYRIESGKRLPSVPELEAIASVVGLELPALVDKNAVIAMKIVIQKENAHEHPNGN